MEMTRRKLLNGARFLSFTLDGENYCIDILKVKELMGMTAITPLPDNCIHQGCNKSEGTNHTGNRPAAQVRAQVPGLHEADVHHGR